MHPLRSIRNVRKGVIAVLRRAEMISSELKILNNCGLEILVAALQEKSIPVLLNIDTFETHLNCFEYTWYQLPRNLDMMKTATVGHQDSTTGDFFNEICDATPNAHGLAILIETIPTHHTTFRHNDDHRI